ncbi:radical SAM/SPASM domain-containing protein [Raoultibacter phocaeensis]|uniref:radical SAM/SPASM domain-containing protein n=1 Tax=Raoultibacter phocaeensis TaxID=2479841 RepID=UPI00210827CF|nr:radical SAM protein [Raoultibacter phocaeensis]
MVGNLNTGYAIGLTPEGKGICTRLMHEDVPPSKIAAVDEALFQHLGLGGFFGYKKPDDMLKSAYVHVTQRCNLQCVGCYSLDDDRNSLADAPTEKINHAIAQLASAGVEQIVISGGEPFLRDDLASIVAFAKIECSIASVVVLSNGVGLDARQLKRVAPFVDRVSISFDGCSAASPAYIRGKQRFAELVRAVEAVKGANIPPHMIATIHAKNVDDIAEYLTLADELGATLTFSLLSCPCDDEVLRGLIPDDAELEKLGRAMLTLGKGRGPLAVADSPVGASLTVKRVCGAGVKTVSVAADGTVYPCHMLHRAELAMGNLFTDVIHSVLSGEVAQGFSALGTESFERCSACEYERLCGGGCRARSLFASGDLTSFDPYCAMMQEFFGGYGDMLKNAATIRGSR